MAEREQIRRTPAERTGDAETGTEGAPVGSETGDRIKAELDDLLDEIDEVLETNAEDFVRSFVQKGGE